MRVSAEGFGLAIWAEKQASAPPIRRLPRAQLPDWARSARMAWPPPRAFDPASFAPMPFDRRLSAEWGLRRRPREATEREAKARKD
jgi:hypothetical protein